MNQPTTITRLSPATNLIQAVGPYNLTEREVGIIEKLFSKGLSDDEIRDIVGRDCFESYMSAFYPNYNGVA
jgi:hypothetical protein